MQLVQRSERENRNAVRSHQSTLVECTQPSAAAHRRGQDSQPKGLLEAPAITLNHGAQPGGIHLCVSGLALPSSSWLSQWGHLSLLCWQRGHSIIFSHRGGGWSFQGAGKNCSPSCSQRDRRRFSISLSRALFTGVSFPSLHGYHSDISAFIICIQEHHQGTSK